MTGKQTFSVCHTEVHTFYMERVCNNVLRNMSPIRQVYNETELIFDISQMPVKKRTVEQQKMKVAVVAVVVAVVMVVVVAAAAVAVVAMGALAVAVTITMMTGTTMMIIMMNCFWTITATATAAVGYEKGGP